MSDKPKGPKGDDFVFKADEIETRPFHVHRQGMDPPSSITLHFLCPFCGDEIKAYLWSLSGGGKRCECGAMFGKYGDAKHWKKKGPSDE